MTWLRRLFASLLLAACVGAGAGGAAWADCLYPPVVQNPAEVAAAEVDPGPTVPTGSTFSQFGYGGLDVIRYESTTCVAGQSLTGRPSRGMAGVGYTVGKSVAVGVTALAVTLAREVFTDGPLWQVAEAMFAPVMAAFPPSSLALLAVILGPLAVISIVWGARDGDKFGWAVNRYAGIAAIAVVAACCYMWTAVIPDAWGKTAGVSLVAVQEVTTGTAGSPDVAVGDIMTDHVLMPMWARAQLGSDQSAIDTYAWRLRAASTVSRTEVDQINAGETTFAQLAKQKEGDYRQAAQEMSRTHPAAYAHLTGADETGKAWTGILGGGVALAAALVLVVTLLVVAVGKLASFVFAYGFPAAAPFLMMPRLQEAAGRAARFVWVLALASLASVFVFVLWMLGPIRGLMVTTGASMTSRFIALTLIYVLFWVGWRMLPVAVKRVSEREDVKAVRKRVDVVVKAVRRHDSTDVEDGDTEPGDRGHVETGPAVAADEPVPDDAPAPVDDPDDREGFNERVETRIEDTNRPDPGPVDDPDHPAQDVDEDSDRAAFWDRVTDRFSRMEEDALERRRARLNQMKEDRDEAEVRSV